MRVFAVLIFAVFLTACSTLPNAVRSNIPYSGQGKAKVFIVSHGWHTGFVVPSKSIIQFIPELKSRFPNAPFIEFGWGDKGFYQAQEITTKITLQAIFWPTESVVHAVAVPNENVAAYFSNSDVKVVKVTNAQLTQLNRFISGSFARRKGVVLTQKTGIYGDSQFYKGVGSYYLMNTCNKWTAKGLQSMGMDISPMFKLTSGSVMGYLQEKAAP